MKSLFRMVAATCAALVVATQMAQAGTIVADAQGQSSQTLLTGTAAGLDVDLNNNSPTPAYQAPFNLINGVAISGPTIVFSTLVLTGNTTSMTGNGTLTIYDGTNVVTADFAVTASVTFVPVPPSGADFLNIAGTISNVVQSNVAGGTYDWAQINSGLISITKTGKGIQKLVNGSGTILTNASFDISASVPEPSSLALLGLGGVGMAFAAIRRRNAAV